MSRFARPDYWGIPALVLITILLRAYGLGFPNYHWDENIDFNNVFSASYNRLALLTYVHGSLHPYLMLAVWNLRLLYGGIEPSTSNLLHAFFADPRSFTILARGLAVLASTVTVVLTLVLGRRLYNPRIGWLSSILLAGTFLHAAESHYARTHIITTLFVVSALYYSSRIMKDGNQKDYLLAGISLGLATAAQYSMFITAVPVLYAHIAHLNISRGIKNQTSLSSHRPLTTSAGIALITFFCATPYAIIDAQRFFSELKFIAGDVTQVWVDSAGQPVWLFYLTEHLKNGMGTVLAFISVMGLAHAIVRRSRSDILLIAFLVPLFITLANGANFARYLIPGLPLLAILAASLLDRMFSLLKTRVQAKWIQAGQILAVAMVLAQPVLNIVRFDFWLTQPDTRQTASEWIVSHLPQGSRIAIEGAGVLGPNVPLDRKHMEQLLAVQEPGSLGEIYTEALMTSQPPETGFHALSVFRLDQKHKGGVFLETIADSSYYRNLGYDYLVTSSWMIRTVDDAYTPAFQESLDKFYTPIMTFEPTIYFRYDPYSWRIDYTALAQVIPGRQGIGGPKLTIYKLRDIQSGW